MKRIVMSISLFLACIHYIQAKNYVVCVGIADYPGAEMDLKLSAKDAITMGGIYKKNNDAEVLIYINEEAKLNHIKTAMQDLFVKATSTDAIVFFFSGHGVPGGFICYDGMLMYDALTEIMSNSQANCKMIFADACFSGNARKESGDNYRKKAKNVIFFLSSRSGEKSLEWKKGWKNSLFTAFLERGLRGGADTNKDRIITAKEIFLFVSNGVAEQSLQMQHPVMWGRFNDEMPVMSWKKK